MKNLVFAFCTLMVLAACGGKSEVAEKDTISSVAEDTVMPLLVDNEDSVVALVKVPKAADVLFYDFVASFCQNKTYQKSRIKFPLPCVHNGHQYTVSEADWEFSELHYDSDIYTVFFPNAKSLILENSTEVDKVCVKWYEMEDSIASDYFFEKLDNLWMLTAIDIHPVSQDSDRDFVTFFSSFVNDEDFQLSHIAETIIYDGIDLDSDDDFDAKMVRNKHIDASLWDNRMIPELSGTHISNIDFGQDLTGDRRLVSVEAPSSGFNCRIYFQKSNNDWQLYKVENY